LEYAAGNFGFSAIIIKSFMNTRTTLYR